MVAVSPPTVWHLARHAARLLKHFCWVGAPILPFDHDSGNLPIWLWDEWKKNIEHFHLWGSYSSCSYFKPTKCKSDCRQLVLLALAVRHVDKWLQAGGLLINRSSLHSSAPSMSTHAPRTDIHLAISNLKSGQCVFIRVRWGREVLVHWRTEWELCGISQHIPDGPFFASNTGQRKLWHGGWHPNTEIWRHYALPAVAWLCCITQRVNKSREKVSFSQRRVKSLKLSSKWGNSIK